MSGRRVACGGMALGLAWVLGQGAGAADDKKPTEALLVHVGGTMRPAMERICRMFEEKTGEKVALNYGDSGSLMTAIETSGKGDVCVVHDPFPVAMEKKGLVDRSYTVATLTPVICVRKGNPKGIRTIRDLVRADVKVGLPDANYSTTGHIAAWAFRKAGIAEAMASKEIVRARGGGEVANALKVGALDAAIVWNAVVFARRDDLEAVPIEPDAMPRPGVDAVTSATYGVLDMSQTKVGVMTLKRSANPEKARQLAELAASGEGRKVFADLGFSPAPATATVAPAGLSGSLFLYCAVGMKGPVAEIAAQFEKETGVKVEITYANSGQLLGQIEAARTGDVYIPGDVGFAAKAREKRLAAEEPRPFCYFVPAIYVRKGNPKGVRDVADLAKPGLKLALADPSAAVGPLQAQVFRKNGVDEQALRKNTVVSPATVADVALAVKMGTVDAGIIWDVFSDFAPDEAEAVRIPVGKNAISTVAACTLAGSKNPAAARAFLDFLVSEKGKAILRARGYTLECPK